MSKENENNILIIVAARLARRECLTKLHDLCDLEQRVVSKRGVRDAVEHAEEAIARECSKIVRGHNMLAKKLLDAESEVSALQEQVRALVVENSVLKSVVNECREYFIAGIRNKIRPTNEGYLHMICDTVAYESLETDAVLREIRAQAIEAFAEHIAFYHSDSKSHALDYAASIRSGEKP